MKQFEKKIQKKSKNQFNNDKTYFLINLQEPIYYFTLEAPVNNCECLLKVGCMSALACC